MITQAELKSLFNYSPETGIFTRITSKYGRTKKGDISGCRNGNGYLIIQIKGNLYLSHRLAWLYVYGVWPSGDIDHINHVRHDNRWCNLREVTRKENCKNRAISKNNNTGVSGVSWSKRQNKWQVTTCVNRKRIHLGYFLDKFEAICCRKSANNKYGFHKNHG